MSDIRPVWLGVARAWARVNQSELAQRAGCSQATISKIESGLTRPDDGLLLKLAATLAVPPRLLASPESVVPPTFSFHRKRQTSKRDINRLWAALNILRVALTGLLAQVDLEPTLDLPSIDLDDIDSPADTARALRAGWMIEPGPITDLTDLVERAGVAVLCFDFELDAVDGVSHPAAAGLPPVIFLNSRFPGCRLRHTLAHELAHLILHRFPTPTMEKEANEFAAELLLPAAEVRHLLRPPLTIGRLGTLKRSWGVSMASLIYRASALRTITKDQHRRLMIMMGPYRKVEPVQIERESPQMVSDIVAYFRTELDYTNEELVEALALPQSQALFGALGIASESGGGNTDRRLRLVCGSR